MANQSKLSGDTNPQKPRQRFVDAPIPMERPKNPTLIKGQYETMKLRTTPTEATSPTYEITLNYFLSRTPEEWLIFEKNLDKVILGQNLTTGMAKYAIVRRVLTGNALATFNAAADQHGNVTNENYRLCMADVTKHVFPAKALQTQKRFMRRYLRKPNDKTIREHAARVVEMNNWLTEFPPIRDNQPATKLSDDALLEVLEFGCPNSWQKQMVLQDFDPMEHTVQEFTRFCERIEKTEERPDVRKNKDSNHKPNHQGNNRKRFRGSDDREDKPKAGNKKGDCMLHGEGCGHTSDQCYTLKAQAKRMKGTYDTQHPDKKKQYKKNQELHAIIAEAVENAMKKDSKSAGKRKRVEEIEEEENYNFEKLSIKSTDDESVSSEQSA